MSRVALDRLLAVLLVLLAATGLLTLRAGSIDERGSSWRTAFWEGCSW